MLSDNYVHIPPRIGEARTTLANITKIRNMLGWEPVVKLEDWMASAREKVVK